MTTHTTLHRNPLMRDTRRWLNVAVAATVWTIGAPASAGGQPAAQSTARYQAILAEQNLMIPTRDGVRMATDIYRPARNGVPVTEKLPVLLNRTPYDKTGLAAQARFFAERGYVVAVQDIRGRYKSEGTYSKLQAIGAEDGYDVIQYLGKLPYSTGQVGTWGTSYAAHMQAGAAQLNPSAMKTAVINQGGMPNAWDHGVRYRGTYELGRQPRGRGPRCAPTRARPRCASCSIPRKWRTGTTCSRCGADRTPCRRSRRASRSGTCSGTNMPTTMTTGSRRCSTGRSTIRRRPTSR
ncbi:MAG: CocE/NonD family hydrolase [Gemmatimonadetes bacterium]|nr:CocE/NonD family hydrolase [Gemmatimonadota bacterium]